MDTRTWIGCIIVVNDRPITIAASDEPVSSATHVVHIAGEARAR
jgi:hypothetical protein